MSMDLAPTAQGPRGATSRRLRGWRRRRKLKRKRVMIFEVEQNFSQAGDTTIAAAPITGGLPLTLALTQRAAGVLRAYLSDNQLGHYRIFRSDDDEMFNAEWHLEALSENTTAWEALPALVEGGEPVAVVTHDP